MELQVVTYNQPSSKQEKLLAYNDLREWMAALDRAGELKRITTEVDPILEIAEITDRVSKMNAAQSPTGQAGGPALLFENVKGYRGLPVLVASYTCIRYMPTLRFPFFGSRVITQGSVINRPPSFGQHCKIGKSNREKSPFLITCLQGALVTVFGKNLPISASMGSIFTLSRIPCGDFMSMNARMREATSSRLSTSNAIRMRRAEPN